MPLEIEAVPIKYGCKQNGTYYITVEDVSNLDFSPVSSSSDRERLLFLPSPLLDLDLDLDLLRRFSL